MATRAKTPAKIGRPSEYREEYAEKALEFCLLGATDKEIAEIFGVSKQTLNTWKKKHPDFLASLRKGKQEADGKVARSLYTQAISGNVTAAIFWLKNRRRETWRDKYEHDVAGDINVTIQRFTDGKEDPATE